MSESAVHTAGYDLIRFEAIHKQAGYTGSVEVMPDKTLQFSLREGTRVSTTSEDVKDPVVVGPTLFGFILAHWDVLVGGHAVPVRFVVMDRQETFGFVIERATGAAGHTAFTMTASDPLVRLVVKPLRFEFETESRKIVRYQGRVPPRRTIKGSLEDLDARVEYSFRAAQYR